MSILKEPGRRREGAWFLCGAVCTIILSKWRGQLLTTKNNAFFSSLSSSPPTESSSLTDMLILTDKVKSCSSSSRRKRRRRKMMKTFFLLVFTSHSSPHLTCTANLDGDSLNVSVALPPGLMTAAVTQTQVRHVCSHREMTPFSISSSPGKSW